jgi:hypothetical protein
LNLEFQGSTSNAPRFFDFKTHLDAFHINQKLATDYDQEAFGPQIPGSYEAKLALPGILVA